MRLKKGTTYLMTFISIVVIGIGGIIIQNQEIVLKCIDALLWLTAIGLGASVGDSIQKSVWYKSELDKEK